MIPNFRRLYLLLRVLLCELPSVNSTSSPRLQSKVFRWQMESTAGAFLPGSRLSVVVLDVFAVQKAHLVGLVVEPPFPIEKDIQMVRRLGGEKEITVKIKDRFGDITKSSRKDHKGVMERPGSPRDLQKSSP